jgi:hypothetical protein
VLLFSTINYQNNRCMLGRINCIIFCAIHEFRVKEHDETEASSNHGNSSFFFLIRAPNLDIILDKRNIENTTMTNFFDIIHHPSFI